MPTYKPTMSLNRWPPFAVSTPSPISAASHVIRSCFFKQGVVWYAWIIINRGIRKYFRSGVAAFAVIEQRPLSPSLIPGSFEVIDVPDSPDSQN